MNIECGGSAMILNDKNLLLGPKDGVLQNNVTVILSDSPKSVLTGKWLINCPLMQKGYCSAFTKDLKPLPVDKKYPDFSTACKYLRTNPAKLPPHEPKGLKLIFSNMTRRFSR